MRSTPTDATAPTRRHVASTRGTAAIELLLVTMFILIPILLLTGAMLVLGPARILNPFQANEQAYQDAINAAPAGSVPNVQLTPESGTLDPAVQALEQMNQIHEATATANITLTLGKWTTLPPVTLTNKSEFNAPPWAYSSWPAVGDRQYLEGWVENYASESTEQTLPSGSTPRDALMLRESWPP